MPIRPQISFELPNKTSLFYFTDSLYKTDVKKALKTWLDDTHVYFITVLVKYDKEDSSTLMQDTYMFANCLECNSDKLIDLIDTSIFFDSIDKKVRSEEIKCIILNCRNCDIKHKS